MTFAQQEKSIAQQSGNIVYLWGARVLDILGYVGTASVEYKSYDDTAV
jgi:hypothetical protein